MVDLSVLVISTPYVRSLLSVSIWWLIVDLPTIQYQLALHQIDSLRKDGKFMSVDGYVPEGQGIVMAHLNECHELLEMVCHPIHSYRLLEREANTQIAQESNGRRSR